MITLKKIMSVIAIAFAVMTIAGSGIISNAGGTDPGNNSSAGNGVISPCKNNADAPGCKGLFGGFFNPTGSSTGLTTVQNGIATIGTILVSLIAAISVIFLILGAFAMVSDNGDGKGFATGKTRITNAIIGLVVALISFGIINFIITVVK